MQRLIDSINKALDNVWAVVYVPLCIAVMALVVLGVVKWVVTLMRAIGG